MVDRAFLCRKNYTFGYEPYHTNSWTHFIIDPSYSP